MRRRRRRKSLLLLLWLCPLVDGQSIVARPLVLEKSGDAVRIIMTVPGVLAAYSPAGADVTSSPPTRVAQVNDGNLTLRLPNLRESYSAEIKFKFRYSAT